MNRLFELQDSAGDAGPPSFSPTNFDAPPPSAAAATSSSNDDDNKQTDNKTGKTVSFVNIADAQEPDNRGGTSAVEMGAREDEYVVTQDENLDLALKLIEEIQAGNRKIQATTLEMRAQQALNLKNFNPASADADTGGDKIEDLMDAVSATSREIKAKLDQLSEETKKLEADEAVANANAGTIKIQQNQHNYLTRTFMQAINDYNAAVGENEKQLRDQAVRRIKLKYTKADGSTVSDDEARQMAAQVMEFGRTDMLFQASKETLAQVLETRQDILRIERSMRELKQIMDDLSALISEQGEVLDQVLTNVQTARQYVGSGREKLKSARDYAKKASSKMKYIVCCFAVLFIIILAIVLGATLPTF